MTSRKNASSRGAAGREESGSRLVRGRSGSRGKAGASGSTRSARARAELVAALHAAGREQSAATVMFHAAIAQRLDLNASEEKTLDILGRFGPLTAGQLATHTGLARPSVTAMIDRLERKGFARRVANPNDARSVFIEANPDRVGRIEPLFADWVRRLEDLFAKYSDSELEVILRFIQETTDRQREATALLSGHGGRPTSFAR